MCVRLCMLSQVTEHGRERYSFDPRNKERGEGKSSGETAERGARGETGQRRDERERQMALGWKGDGREAESVRQGVRRDQASWEQSFVEGGLKITSGFVKQREERRRNARSDRDPPCRSQLRKNCEMLKFRSEFYFIFFTSRGGRVVIDILICLIGEHCVNLNFKSKLKNVSDSFEFCWWCSRILITQTERLQTTRAVLIKLDSTTSVSLDSINYRALKTPF